jgi:hypothetical protein
MESNPFCGCAACSRCITPLSDSSKLTALQIHCLRSSSCEAACGIVATSVVAASCAGACICAGQVGSTA